MWAAERNQNMFLYSSLRFLQTAGIGDLISVIKYNLNIRFLENCCREKYFHSIKDLNITSGERHYLCSLGGQKVRKWPEWTIVKDVRLKGHTAEKKG